MSAAAATPFALRVRGLGRRFGARVALHPLAFELARGRTLAVLGPNGAGKSTLLRLLAGLMRPSEGAFEVGARAGHARAVVGFAGHEHFSYAALSVRENLELAARLHGQKNVRACAARALCELGLEGVAARRVAQLSHGLARRLGIARALLHAPQLLLLDEPFSGLDPRAATRLAQHLAHFCNGEEILRAAQSETARQPTPAQQHSPAQQQDAPAQQQHSPTQQQHSPARQQDAPAQPTASAGATASRGAGYHDGRDGHRGGRACVLVTHDMARAVELAQQALVLVRGRARVLPVTALADAGAAGAAYHAAVAALETSA